MRFKDRAEEASMSAGDVDQCIDAREIVGRNYSGDLRAGEVRHRLIEHSALLRMFAKVIEEAHAVDVIECRLAGLHTVEEFGPRLVTIGFAHDQGPGPHGAWSIG